MHRLGLYDARHIRLEVRGCLHGSFIFEISCFCILIGEADVLDLNLNCSFLETNFLIEKAAILVDSVTKNGHVNRILQRLKMVTIQILLK